MTSKKPVGFLVTLSKSFKVETGHDAEAFFQKQQPVCCVDPHGGARRFRTSWRDTESLARTLDSKPSWRSVGHGSTPGERRGIQLAGGYASTRGKLD